METREARIGIVGMGYVGLPLALLFSGEGFRVTGFDIEPAKVANPQRRRLLHRPHPPRIHPAAQQSGFCATSDYAEVAEMDAVIICVPTPLNEYHEPDLSYVTGTVESIAPYVKEGQLIVLESTTYPGTTEEMVVPSSKPAIPAAASKSPANADDTPPPRSLLPEREDPGNDTVARHDIPKVVGGCGPVASELAAAMYGAIFRRVVPSARPPSRR
jgi:UDP-N-acetyl-D-glucosamine dehydrogenase